VEIFPLGQLRTVSGEVTPGNRVSRTLRIRNAAMAVAMDLKGKRVLDLGCAEGLHSLYMAESADEVVGVDHRESVVSIAGKSAEMLEKKNVTFLRGDIRNTNFLKELGRFDLVVAWGFLHRVSDPISALSLICSLSDCLSLEWRTPIVPFAKSISIAYHNPVAEKLDPMNIEESADSAVTGTDDENKIESSSGFWEPTIGAVRAIVRRNGFYDYKIFGYGDRFTSGSVTAFSKWGSHLYRLIARRDISHQIPVGRLHAMFFKKGKAVSVSKPSQAISKIPAWDLAMIEKCGIGKRI